MEQSKGKRIAKNTLVLYVRMLFLMVIKLYTSRIILQTLGVEDYGLYNVVGGFVAMFSILSTSLSGACSRFLNFEMGRGEKERLNKVFSTSVTILFCLAVCIAIICLFVGVWYIKTYMVIPAGRESVALYVFYLSIVTFCVNLISVPYNAAIIAHEQMKTFAYVGLLEGIANLFIAFFIVVSPIDTLVFYAVMITVLQVIIRIIYQVYCKRHFKECTYTFVWDVSLLKSMFGYAGWNFIGTSSAILRNHGNNLILNLFFGPVVNAGRAVANQVLLAVDGFVTNFMTALKPQITQSYSRGDFAFLVKLIYSGSRLSFFMLLFLCIPIIVNADFILSVWLKNVPDYSVPFVRLTLIFTLIESISQPLITAQNATGVVRNYQLVVGGIQFLNVPFSYVALKLGATPESVVIIAIVLAFCCLSARLIMIKGFVPIEIADFCKNVLLRLLLVSFCSSILPVFVVLFVRNDVVAFFSSCILSVVTSVLSIYFLGCNENERVKLKQFVLKIKNRRGI